MSFLKKKRSSTKVTIQSDEDIKEEKKDKKKEKKEKSSKGREKTLDVDSLDEQKAVSQERDEDPSPSDKRVIITPSASGGVSDLEDIVSLKLSPINKQISEMLERFEQVESRIDNLSSKMDEEGQSSRDDVIRKVVTQELEKPSRRDSVSSLGLAIASDDVKKLENKVKSLSTEITAIKEEILATVRKELTAMVVEEIQKLKSNQSNSAPLTKSVEKEEKKEKKEKKDKKEKETTKVEPPSKTEPPKSEVTNKVETSKEVSDDTQDLGAWEEKLPEKEFTEFVKKHGLSKKTIWDFGTAELNSNDIKNLVGVLQNCPKEKRIKTLALNLQSSDVKMRQGKELAVALTEKNLEYLILNGMRRQTGWSLLTALSEGHIPVETIILDSLELPESFSEAQCSKALSYCEWKNLIFQNCKFIGTSYRKEEVNHFFDAIGSGLAINKYTETFTLRNISGSNIGDISKLLKGLEKNDTLKVVSIELEDMWERNGVKILSEFIESSSIPELHIRGFEKIQIDVTDFEKAIESAPSLKKLDLRPLEIPGKKPRGMYVDKSTQEKLKKHAEKNGHLEFQCWNESGVDIVVK